MQRKRLTARANLTGRRYGFLTVLEPAGLVPNGAYRQKLWKCRCVCGADVERTTHQLTVAYREHGSCGCLRACTLEFKRCGGYELSQLYKDWKGIIKTEGVEEDWRETKVDAGFWRFIADVGKDWKTGAELRKMNGSKPWTRENTAYYWEGIDDKRFRLNDKVEYMGAETTAKELAERFGISPLTMLYRLNHDWPDEMLSIKPIRPRKRGA